MLYLKLNIQRFANGTIDLGTSGALAGRIVWSSTSNGSVANTSGVIGDLQIRRTDGYTTTGTFSYYFAVGNKNVNLNWYGSISSSWVSISNLNDPAVAHNSNGVGSCYIHGKVNGPSGTTLAGKTVEAGQSVTLDVIPRYASSNQSLNSKTETTITMNWSSDSIVDYIWYSTDDGTTWKGIDVADGTGGSYTISKPSNSTNNLAHNTTYNIVTRVRRKDSQLTTNSSKLSVTTYNYPYVVNISKNDLLMGENQVLTIYNPLNRECNVYMKQNDTNGTLLYTTTTSGTSVEFIPDKETLYESVLSNEVGNAVYYAEYTDKLVTTLNGTYTCISPKLTSNRWERPTSTGTTIRKSELRGTFYQGIIGNEENLLSIKYRYKQTEDEEFSDYIEICNNISESNDDVTIQNNQFNVVKSITINNMDYKQKCIIEIVVSDNYVTRTFSYEVKKGKPVWWTTEEYFGANQILASKILKSDGSEFGSGVTLYENSSGTKGTITLNETSSNFNAIEVMYGCEGYYYSTGKIYTPNGKKISTPVNFVQDAYDYVNVFTSNWTISGTSISFKKAANKYLTGTVSTYGENAYVRIYKVVGYR